MKKQRKNWRKDLCLGSVTRYVSNNNQPQPCINIFPPIQMLIPLSPWIFLWNPVKWHVKLNPTCTPCPLLTLSSINNAFLSDISLNTRQIKDINDWIYQKHDHVTHTHIMAYIHGTYWIPLDNPPWDISSLTLILAVIFNLSLFSLVRNKTHKSMRQSPPFCCYPGFRSPKKCYN